MADADTPIEVAWDERGLAPAVVQDAASGRLLMLAWMNREALAETRATGLAHFYSRSRARLWKKGETSGNTLAVHEIRVDCDADAILLVAEPAGPACHTGKPSCFFRRLGGGEDEGARGQVLGRLADVLEERRRAATPVKSYTRALLDAGMPAILAKIAEEHAELADELPAGERARVVHEAADLLFHLLVGLCARGVHADEVLAELQRRFGRGGHEEKASR